MPLPVLAAPERAEATDETSVSEWHGWSAVELPPTGSAREAPEPELPQGAYGHGEAALDFATHSIPVVPPGAAAAQELLAPAGGPEAGYAAFHYGADAVYLGLKKFSARAEAENFTLDELAEFTAYAHQLAPRRRVFVTINTVIRQDELAELVDDVVRLAEIGVDAIILQDLGVYRLLRQHFPAMELHASTQLAVHDRAGAEAARQLGFARVVLARELTFEEVHDITAASGIETEVFVHGALCYSYSGLCLFSSQTLGRSGNRGKCAYSCRDAYQVADAPLTLRDGSPVRRDPRQGFPFSMKDLALPDHLPALRAAGVSCFKIEGRKKSPLYVATTTRYYRDLLDGRLSPDERPEREADLQAVFSRPWTKLFVASHKDKEVADRDTVGHRGTPIGTVESVPRGTGPARVRFVTSRPIERHDGLQIDLPTQGKPFGFAVDRLWIVDGPRPRDAFEAPAGSRIEVALPESYPSIPRGAPVYCSSSQAVKREYSFDLPKPGTFRPRVPVAVELRLTSDRLTARGRVASPQPGEPPVIVERSLPGPFAEARDAAAMESAVRTAFDKLGDTRLTWSSFAWHDDERRFVPVSQLNRLRREFCADLEAALDAARGERIARLQADVCRGWGFQPQSIGVEDDSGWKPEPRCFRWSLKVDRIAFVDAFEPADWDGLDELVVDIARDHPRVLTDRLTQLAAQLGRDRLRLALPPLARAWEEHGLQHKIEKLRALGWTKWEVANLAGWHKLGLDPSRGVSCAANEELELDLATDWSVYVVNRLAAEQVLAMGATRFALSPEDGLANWRSLWAEFGSRAVTIVHQDTPQFLAESCAYANLIGGCPGKANCRFESMEMVSSHGERVTALDYHCRTIVLNQGPYCLSPHLAELADAGAESLRVDFLYRPYDPAVVRDRWRDVRAGRNVPGGYAANFRRGLQ